MSDTVAIISIISGAVVALGSVGATTFTGVAQRRWQSREERASDLRDVLDEATAAIARRMQSIGTAYALLTPPGNRDPDRAMAELPVLTESMSTIWSAANRAALRRGADSAIARALRDVQDAIGKLGALVKIGVTAPGTMSRGYQEAWDRARDREMAFYHAAATELRQSRR